MQELNSATLQPDAVDNTAHIRTSIFWGLLTRGKLVRRGTLHALCSIFCQLQKGLVTEGVNIFLA
jgi:hypothetical protein